MATKRTTVFFELEIHRALRLEAEITGRSISGLVNDAVKAWLAGEVEDSLAYEERKSEPTLSFDEVVQDLKRRGRI